MTALAGYSETSAVGVEIQRLGKGVIRTIATTAHTLELVDNGQTIDMTSSSSNAVTVPPNASVAFPVGAEINIRQGGTGATTIVSGSGVTFEYPAADTLVIHSRYCMTTVKKMATNIWTVVGRMVAA